MENKLKEFVTILRNSRKEMNSKRRYMIEHSFSKEADYLATKINVIDEVLMNLEPISEGKDWKVILEF